MVDLILQVSGRRVVSLKSGQLPGNYLLITVPIALYWGHDEGII
jgi:hypothetical protein